MEKGSEHVTILNKDDWKEVQVQERGKEPRHISANDRFRFVINNEMLLRDSTEQERSESFAPVEGVGVRYVTQTKNSSLVDASNY